MAGRSNKKSAAKKPAQRSIKKVSLKKRITKPIAAVWGAIAIRQKNFLNRRPHRSFRVTRRRDYKRQLALPGYWSFTNQVRILLARRRWLFIKFTVLYGILLFIIFGLMSQDNYTLLNQTLHSLGNNLFQTQIGEFSVNFAVFTGIVTGVFNTQLSPVQQVYGGLLFLLSWLTLIWLLRQVMAGHTNVRLRDGMYFSGSPLVPMFLLFMVVLVQLIPITIALTAYLTANTLNVLDIPILSIAFWLIELLLVLMSVYWISSSFIALVIITLPGMYPLKALKIAGDLVTGRRLRILYRLAWLLLSLFVIWLVVLTPAIMLSNLINLSWLPLVPLTVLLLGSASLVWSATYIYLLYRKLVDDAASPA